MSSFRCDDLISVDSFPSQFLSVSNEVLLWLESQPKEEAWLCETPYDVEVWQLLIEVGVVDIFQKDEEPWKDWIRLKSSEELLTTSCPLPRLEFVSGVSGAVAKLDVAGRRPIYFEIGNIDSAELFMPSCKHQILLGKIAEIVGDPIPGPVPPPILPIPPGHDSFKAKDNYPRNYSSTTNQGRGAKIKWKHLAFRSDHEVAIAQALDNLLGRGVMFFPNAAVRLTAEGRRVTKEVDFLICRDGHWGILEVDGVQHRESRAEDQVRDDAFNDYGVWFIRRYTAKDCIGNALHVVTDFLRRLDAFYAHLSR